MIIPGIDDNYIVPLLGERRAKELAKALKNGKTIIIGGTQGPTGKTTLCRKLQEAGYPAVEYHDTYGIYLVDPVPGYENHPAFDEKWMKERVAIAIMLGE